ncbi:MAG: radical SAM family heme chaperone HemW [Alphaproteobacteria bacterium]|nr:radical SAM family heme chaperone HemW [Alphaproteobacteria bacterium]
MFAIYIHFPFCVSKCPYCDFNSHVPTVIDYELWKKAYDKELEAFAKKDKNKKEVTSVFFGGGTPSLMPPDLTASVINSIQKHWRLSDNTEITLEANPSAYEAGKFRDFQAAGINRLSLGVQSLEEEVLRFFNRPHNAKEALEALENASNIFGSYSLDMIYGHKYHDNPNAWYKELERALQFSEKHISLYQLTIEPNTKFFVRAGKGEQLLANEDSVIELYKITQELTQKYCMPAYEVSNHAKPGFESIHNKTYWNYDEYIGIGPGASSRFMGHAIENIKAPYIWLDKVLNGNAWVKSDEVLDTETALREAFMMGLRLTEGININNWKQKFGSDIFCFISSDKLKALENKGLVLYSDTYIKTTPKGTLCLNAVLNYILN